MIYNIFANQKSKVRITEQSKGRVQKEEYIQHSNTWKYFFDCPTQLAES